MGHYEIIKLMLVKNICFLKTLFSLHRACEVTQSCPTLCDPMVICSLPGSSVHGIFQAIVLEWIAISFSSTQGIGSDY